MSRPYDNQFQLSIWMHLFYFLWALQHRWLCCSTCLILEIPRRRRSPVRPGYQRYVPGILYTIRAVDQTKEGHIYIRQIGHDPRSILHTTSDTYITVTGPRRPYYDPVPRMFFFPILSIFMKKKVFSSAAILLSLIHIWRCRRLLTCRSRWSPYH